jgi:NAD+ synthase
MAALYCAAQSLDYLVVGTGNKSERMIGYFTKWGDGATDISPIANLYKHQVYALARELSIPEEVINKAPTADLWEGQTDENEIGMAYEELDVVLAGIESGELSELSPKSVEKVRKMIASSEHKRCTPPAFEP